MCAGKSRLYTYLILLLTPPSTASIWIPRTLFPLLFLCYPRHHHHYQNERRRSLASRQLPSRSFSLPHHPFGERSPWAPSARARAGFGSCYCRASRFHLRIVFWIGRIWVKRLVCKVDWQQQILKWIVGGYIQSLTC